MGSLGGMGCGIAALHISRPAGWLSVRTAAFSTTCRTAACGCITSSSRTTTRRCRSAIPGSTFAALATFAHAARGPASAGGVTFLER